MRARGWDELDVLIVTGDAYVDHPAFGPILEIAVDSMRARIIEGFPFRIGFRAA